MREVLYDWGGFNVWLFHAVNEVRSGVLDGFMQLGTALGDHDLFALYLALIATLGLWRLSGMAASVPERLSVRALDWLTVLATLSLAYFIDGLLVTWLKHGLDFPRPPLALTPGSLHVIGTPELHHSLPSGHATFAMTLGASLWPLLRRRGRIALALFVLWVGISRVSLGMHFPADVVAGYLLGLMVVLAARFVLAGLVRYSVSR